MKLLLRAWKVFQSRPIQFAQTARGYVLFATRSPILKRVFGRAGSPIHLANNVRIQSFRSLSAERPRARIEIGSHAVLYENARLAAYGDGVIRLGQRCVVGDVRIYARSRIQIGDRCVFSWNVFLQDFDPHPISPDQRALQMIELTENFQPYYGPKNPRAALVKQEWHFTCDPIELGDDVWIGAGVTILPGARVGSGSILAAGAVVTRGNYPARSILAGNPARVVKQLPDEFSSQHKGSQPVTPEGRA